MDSLSSFFNYLVFEDIIELFFYVLIVIVGLVLLIMGKIKGPEPPSDTTPPPAQATLQRVEKWNNHACFT